MLVWFCVINLQLVFLLPQKLSLPRLRLSPTMLLGGLAEFCFWRIAMISGKFFAITWSRAVFRLPRCLAAWKG